MDDREITNRSKATPPQRPVNLWRIQEDAHRFFLWPRFPLRFSPVPRLTYQTPGLGCRSYHEQWQIGVYG